MPRPTASSPHSGHYVVEPPPVRFARSGDARIAFRVMGEGPLNVVVLRGVPGEWRLYALRERG
ncbi:MAG TPA: hypothetical protein VFB39_11165 [Solirubrobacteraceae bacterium]|nr:hypothetical protein [Solirubrobacteraceae bacterium]